VPKQGSGPRQHQLTGKAAVQRAVEENRIDNPWLKELVMKILGNKSHPEIKVDERFTACIAFLRRSEASGAPVAPQAASEIVLDHKTVG
jgi:hypothetical protein